jgi:hypothetical protein
MLKSLRFSTLTFALWQFLGLLNIEAAIPANPNATKEAKSLLDYFYSVYGQKIVSGQQECGYCSNPAVENNYLMEKTGKYPAILGMDMADRNSRVIDRGIAWWKAGGIPMYGWHFGYPTQGDTYEGSKFVINSADIDKVLTVGSNENTLFNKRLDEGAVKLKQLQDANIPVLWRPFHEAGDNCAWFWWGMGGGSQFVRLWKYMFDYYTTTKKLNNLIWMVPSCGSPGASYYPPKEYYDMGGADNYASDHGTLKNMYTKVKSIVGNTVPIALHENGPIPDPDQLKSSSTNWVMFNTWNQNYLMTESSNSVAFLKSTYNHEYVITRDELPNLNTFSNSAFSNRHPFQTKDMQARITPGGLWVYLPYSDKGMLAVLNLAGKTVAKVNISAGAETWHWLPTPGLVTGIHFIQAVTESYSLSKRICF